MAYMDEKGKIHDVAPRTGAWIETGKRRRCMA